MPTCTVAIPVFNRRDPELNHLAVDSALAQPLDDLEILVIDDCSTDGTWELLQSYRDPRLRLLRNEQNVGLFGNFNECLLQARGEYLRILCSDDRLMPDTLRSELEIMKRHPEIVLLSTRGVRVDAEGKPLGGQADHFAPGVYDGEAAISATLWFKAYYGYNPLNYPSGVLLRRSAALQAGLFDTRMQMSGDVDFFLRILSGGYLGVMNHVGCAILIHPDQVGTHLAGDMAVMEEDYILVNRFRSVLERSGMYERILRQLGGVCLGFAQKSWRMGRRDVGARQLHLARAHDASLIHMFVGLVRLIGLRALFRTIGVRICPVRPIASL